MNKPNANSDTPQKTAGSSGQPRGPQRPGQPLKRVNDENDDREQSAGSARKTTPGDAGASPQKN
ncbi:hypothetical protein [Roseinatronobacter alkalisoli]|uniref:Uncharacterized protein n=1 Tax=Roseinatronobacter alkalisoli TaxID=3028235 RepID=A0ABT5TCC7_9RHOB|nr:hypothetical protein [Roseinatronobacter sp. HJB301]MDD7972779.1 hypothetical protein [Roseinatronobacter sp. HJB301]